MIGVTADFSDYNTIREFFELFKTEWEFERPGITYDVVIRPAASLEKPSAAPLVIIYGTDSDNQGLGQQVGSVCRTDRTLLFNNDRLPINGRSLTFRGSCEFRLLDEVTGDSAIVFIRGSAEQTVVRVGYDLWEEIRFLLGKGQPESVAAIPTLELHIELLRRLLLESGVAFSEVPPVPIGCKFIACLTHDVDHASIRAHKLDRTIGGFVYRAALQSLFYFCTGRKSFVDLLRNWAAVVRLPFVQLGWLPDIWSGFENYAELEQGLPSTFFVVSKADDPGGLRDGAKAPKLRAVRYRLGDIAGQLCRLMSAGHEIALHGLNAWLTAKEADKERAVLQTALGHTTASPLEGVRMHWLYYDEASPAALDQAGFQYDSSVGYNSTIGYRSGTCQVYQPLGVRQLKELPLHIMDTALLFPSYMDCRPAEAKVKIKALIANAVRFGGVLTINWHDRSILPERLWQRLYLDIIGELKSAGAWFASAANAVAWFNKRRAFTFDPVSPGELPSTDALPGLCIRKHNSAQAPSPATEFTGTVSSKDREWQFASTAQPLNA